MFQGCQPHSLQTIDNIQSISRNSLRHDAEAGVHATAQAKHGAGLNADWYATKPRALQLPQEQGIQSQLFMQGSCNMVVLTHRRNNTTETMYAQQYHSH